MAVVIGNKNRNRWVRFMRGTSGGRRIINRYGDINNGLIDKKPEIQGTVY